MAKIVACMEGLGLTGGNNAEICGTSVVGSCRLRGDTLSWVVELRMGENHSFSKAECGVYEPPDRRF